MAVENNYEYDELKIYRGEDFQISDYISISQPTLNEICDFGEKEYYSMIYNFCATPQTLKAQLWELGIDYTTITPYKLFYSLLYKIYPQEKTSILFGNLDFTKFELMQRTDDGSFFLFQSLDDEIDVKGNSFLKKIMKKQTSEDAIIIDEYTYNLITDYIRQVHGIEKDERIPANEMTKMVLIEDAQESIKRAKDEKYHSQLKPLISTMINSEGFKYNHSEVWNMKINAFMDAVMRVTKIQNAKLLLQSGYSGFGVDLSKIDKKQLDWIGELN